MNHEYRMKFLNESRIIEVKQDRNHEYPKSNDSASIPEYDWKAGLNTIQRLFFILIIISDLF